LSPAVPLGWAFVAVPGLAALVPGVLSLGGDPVVPGVALED
jgi:hypothetical protein